MKTRSIIQFSCALVALVMLGCDGDTMQPTSSDAAGKPSSAQYATSDGAYQMNPSSDPNANYDSSGAVPPGSGPVQRPISDFISQQGTYCQQSSSGDCYLYGSPVQNFVVWYVQDQNMTIAVDYAGLMDSWLRTHSSYSYGTSFGGNVTEEPLPDGRATETINLDVSNAMVYMVSGTDLNNGPVRFGYKVTDLASQKFSAATGHATLQLTFVRGAMGRPLPDLVQLLKTPRPDDQPVMSSFRFDGNGEFHSESGQIQKAHVVVSQQGELMAGYPGMEYATAPMGYASLQWWPLS
jgi:hypothetical protein